MGFVLKSSNVQASDCKSFTVTDTSGTYSATTNPTGYGNPNPALVDAAASRILVTPFGSATTTTITTSATLPTTARIITNVNIGLASTALITDGLYLIRYEVDFTYAIQAVNAGAKQFTITGNLTGIFTVGVTFTIAGSTGNNGTYTVSTSTYSAPSTTITVTETVPSAVADGSITITFHTSQYELFFCSGEACLNEKLQAVDVTDCEDCYNGKIEIASKVHTLLQAAKYAALCGKVNKAQKLLNYITDLCGLTSCKDC